MDPTLLIFACIALGAVAVLCVTLAFVAVRAGKNLQQMVGTIDSMAKDVSEIKDESIPLIVQATEVLQQTDAALAKLDRSLDNIEGGSQAFLGIAQDTRNLEREVVRRLQPAIEDMTSLATAGVKGVTTFLRNLLDR